MEEDLKKQLDDCQKKAEEYLAGWQRTRADFLNYKKEEMERVGEFLKYANEELILKILPILDNFEIAVRQGKNDQTTEGFSQIKSQLEDFLKNQGVEEIKSLGEKFDPNFHEVVEEVGEDSPLQSPLQTKETGIIIEEIQKGYKINGRLLRPARVKVVK